MPSGLHVPNGFAQLGQLRPVAVPVGVKRDPLPFQRRQVGRVFGQADSPIERRPQRQRARVGHASHGGIELFEWLQFLLELVDESPAARGRLVAPLVGGGQVRLVRRLEIHHELFLVGLRVVNQAAEFVQAALLEPMVDDVDRRPLLAHKEHAFAADDEVGNQIRDRLRFPGSRRALDDVARAAAGQGDGVGLRRVAGDDVEPLGQRQRFRRGRPRPRAARWRTSPRTPDSPPCRRPTRRNRGPATCGDIASSPASRSRDRTPSCTGCRPPACGPGRTFARLRRRAVRLRRPPLAGSSAAGSPHRSAADRCLPVCGSASSFNSTIY